VLTAKHHDGFCLWPSEYTQYCTRNSPGRPDVVGEYVEAFRKAGLKTGLYYSLWDRNFPHYDDDDAYAEYMMKQMEELLANYGEIIHIWFDGAWDKDHPTREWPFDPAWEGDPTSGLHYGERWHWRELYDKVHELQPDLIMMNNSSSDRPGGFRYLPVDARTAEHFTFIYNDTFYRPRTDPIFEDENGQQIYLPLEYSTSLNPAWFWTGAEYIHPTAETIAGWYATARATESNLCVNVGPNANGLVPEYHREFLTKAAGILGL
jgi:alpha-L-fucosidase